MSPITVSLIQCCHDELSLHFTDRLAGLKPARFRALNTVVKQIRRCNLQASAQGESAVDNVFQLTDVARPTISLEQPDCFVVWLNVEAAAVFLSEILCKGRDVVFT